MRESLQKPAGFLLALHKIIKNLRMSENKKIKSA